ncbi:MAG: sporulation transcription factor Spo0A [Clostridiales bacterium]|nr:sporulation transcription factor Spo0A [Clostridiales bacterium]
MMKTANIAIFENNEEFLNELTKYIEGVEGFSVCAATANGNTAIDLLKQTKPDVAIVDLVLSGRDGLSVLKYIKNNNLPCVPIAVGSYIEDKIINSAIESGAAYYLVKPVDAETVIDRIRDLSNDRAIDYKIGTNVRDRRKINSIDEKVSNIFVTIGIPPHIKGYTYLREGIKMTVEDQSIINRVTKELYPKIGEKYQTSASKVERAIRHAIEVAWNKGRTDAISSIFGAKVYIGNERPTNSEFIALVADKLLLESLE